MLEVINEKSYKLRPLNSTDIFAISKIIRKIGIKEFQTCFDNPAISNAISLLGDDKKSDNALVSVGIVAAMEVADVLFAKLPNIENELYEFLASVSGLKIVAIRKLPLAEFMEMVVDVVQMPDFKDFFKVASKLFKSTATK